MSKQQPDSNTPKQKTEGGSSYAEFDPPLVVTQEQLDKAAKELGLTVVNPEISDHPQLTLDEIEKVSLRSCLVEIRVGDVIGYVGPTRAAHHPIKVTVLGTYLTPNGINSPELVAMVTASYEGGGIVQATSDKFFALRDVEYLQRYPSDDFMRKEEGNAEVQNATQERDLQGEIQVVSKQGDT